MRVRKLESDYCVACSGNCRECARWIMVVIVRAMYGSTIVRRPQCRTVHQTLVYPASSIQGAGRNAANDAYKPREDG